MISFGEAAVADEGGGDADEGEEVLGVAFVASVEAAEAVEPCHGALDRPAVSAEPLGGFDAFARQARGDVPAAEPSAQVIVVVTLVAVELGRPASARAAA